MSVYTQQGNTINVSADGAFVIHEQLPPAVYNIQLPPMQPPVLVQREPLPMPKRVYGDISGITEHILTAFEQRPANTGVLLSGMKGSGKTLIARNVSNKLLERGIPTIIVAPTQISPAVISFLQLITSPCMLLFDEIDKIPGEHGDMCAATDCMLGFLDGLCIGKKLSVLTVNARSRVNVNFLDRPGRILYHYKFDGITVETAKQFCLDHLVKKEQWVAFERIVQFAKNLSFDMLQAIVEECNRFNCTPSDALKVLNVNPTISGTFKYSAVSKKGYRVWCDEYATEQLNFERLPWWIDPAIWVEYPEAEITEAIRERYYVSDKIDKLGQSIHATAGHLWVKFEDNFNVGDYKSIEHGTVVYEPYDDIILTFSPYTFANQGPTWED